MYDRRSSRSLTQKIFSYKFFCVLRSWCWYFSCHSTIIYWWLNFSPTMFYSRTLPFDSVAVSTNLVGGICFVCTTLYPFHSSEYKICCMLIKCSHAYSVHRWTQNRFTARVTINGSNLVQTLSYPYTTWTKRFNHALEEQIVPWPLPFLTRASFIEAAG